MDPELNHAEMKDDEANGYSTDSCSFTEYFLSNGPLKPPALTDSGYADSENSKTLQETAADEDSCRSIFSGRQDPRYKAPLPEPAGSRGDNGGGNSMHQSQKWAIQRWVSNTKDAGYDDGTKPTMPLLSPPGTAIIVPDYAIDVDYVAPEIAAEDPAPPGNETTSLVPFAFHPSRKIHEGGSVANFICFRCAKYHHGCVMHTFGPPLCQKCAELKRNRPASCSYIKKVNQLTFYRQRTDPIAGKAWKVLGLDKDLMTPALENCIPNTELSFSIRQNGGPELQLIAMQYSPVPLKYQRAGQANLGELDINSMYRHRYMLDLEYARRQINTYSVTQFRTCFRLRVPNPNSLEWDVFSHAWNLAMRMVPDDPKQHTDEDQVTLLMKHCLAFWTAARMIEAGWCFSSPETLGLASAPGQDSAPFVAATFVDFQFAGIVAELLKELQGKVLLRLSEFLTKHHKRNWTVTLFASFIMLHGLSLLAKQQMEFAKNHQKSDFTMKVLIEDMLEAARTLWCFFHDICDPNLPFDADWDEISPEKQDEFRKKRDIDDKHFALLRKIVRDHIRPNVERFKDIYKQGNITDPSYFTGTLFLRRSQLEAL